jgi:hypothetical protein
MIRLLCLILLAAAPVEAPLQLQPSDIAGRWQSSYDGCFYQLHPDHRCERSFHSITVGRWQFIPPGRLELHFGDKPVVLQITGYERFIMHLKRSGHGPERWLRVEPET